MRTKGSGDMREVADDIITLCWSWTNVVDWLSMTRGTNMFA
jgi:hypothetical protein